MLSKISFLTLTQNQPYCAFHDFITITNMVSMDPLLNKLFNDTNYNKQNVIIREI